MKLQGKKSDDVVHMSFDAAMSAAASGALTIAPLDGERGPDMPLAQAPAPGTAPLDGKETAVGGDVLTNMQPAVGAVSSPGLPAPVVVEEPAKVEPTKPADRAPSKA